MNSYRVIRVLTIVESVKVDAINARAALKEAEDLAKPPAATHKETTSVSPWEVFEK